MPRSLLILVPFILINLLPLTTRAQQFIGKNKVALLEDFNKQAVNVSKKDSLLILSYPGSETGSFQKILFFNDIGNCKAEKYVASSADTYKFLLESILAQKKFEWKKINENQYVSQYKDRLMIELPVKKDDYSFTVFYADWTKEVYKILTGN